jgi:hypothetical protein
VDAIETWTEHWIDNPMPFIWHKTAEQIIEKVRSGPAATGSNPRRRTVAMAVAVDSWWSCYRSLREQAEIPDLARLVVVVEGLPDVLDRVGRTHLAED